jgi:DNA invertase Pin-like site-specific DNA recombinase
MKPAAIYARYSTDLQSDRSIEDQIALCRAYAAREGLEVTAVYEDRALSGGSMIGRDGIASLMRDAADRRFEVVIVEALDRLSRDMEDLAGIHKRLSFADVIIRAVHEGEVTTVLVGLRGLVGQLFREDIKHKIRRGMAGRVRSGLSGGSLAYGYRTVPGKPGARAIDEQQAAIVRRIFEEYAAGATPRAIACRLNAEGIPAPQGGTWNASTLNGNGKRGVGMLRNELYVGRMIWGRTRKVVSPVTGAELIRPTAKDAAVAADVSELAIVPRELFDRAAARKEAMSKVHPGRQRGRKHLLSGLLRCGACGAGLYVHAANKHGERRLACSRWRESHDCPDPHTFMLPTVERAVLGGLQAELSQPAAIAEFARVYHEARLRLAAGSVARRRDLERELAANERRLDRIIACIADGHGDPAVLGPQSTSLHRRIAAARAELETIGRGTNVIALHPAAIDRYREHVAHLGEFLASDERIAQGSAADEIRALIETVTVWHGGAHGRVRVQIRGRLAALVAPETTAPNYNVWGKGERVNPIRLSPQLTEACFIVEAAA